MPKKHIASTEGGGGGEEGGGMPGGGGDVAFVPLVMFCRSAVVSRVVSVPLVPLAKRVPSISSVKSRVLSLSGGGRRSPYELVRIWPDGAIRAHSERNLRAIRAQSERNQSALRAQSERNQSAIRAHQSAIRAQSERNQSALRAHSERTQSAIRAQSERPERAISITHTQSADHQLHSPDHQVRCAG